MQKSLPPHPAPGDGARDGGGRRRIARPLRLDDLGADPTVALNLRFADDLGDLAPFVALDKMIEIEPLAIEQVRQVAGDAGAL